MVNVLCLGGQPKGVQWFNNQFIDIIFQGSNTIKREK